jgi:hypothetical protein
LLKKCLQSMLRIRDMLVRIRIRLRILLFSSVTFKMATKNSVFNFFRLLLFEAIFTAFFKDKKL